MQMRSNMGMCGHRVNQFIGDFDRLHGRQADALDAGNVCHSNQHVRQVFPAAAGLRPIRADAHSRDNNFFRSCRLPSAALPSSTSANGRLAMTLRV